MKRFVTCLFALAATPLPAYEFASFSGEQQQLLQEGKSLVWTFEDPATRLPFACVAALLPSPLAEVWALIEDKESAPAYLDGVDVATIVGREGDDLLILQQTRHIGIVKSFRYVVKHHPVPFKRVEIGLVSGDMRNIQGAWYFDPVNDGRETLLVYQLHLDPGFLYPQPFILHQQKQRLPLVMVAIRKRLAELKERPLIPNGARMPRVTNNTPVR